MTEELQRRLREVRQEPPPELDFEAMERRLLAAIERGDRLRPLPVRSPVAGTRLAPVFMAAGLAAVAAAAIALWPTPRRTVRPAPVPSAAPAEVMAAESREQMDGASQRVGQEVRGAMSVRHARRVEWELSADGRAALTSAGERLRVELRAGSLTARVDPGPAAHFGVVVGDTEVVVHGTRFVVTRETSGELSVNLREGEVRVGRRGADAGWRLLAPAEARFDATARLVGEPSGGVAALPGAGVRPAASNAPPPPRDERPSAQAIERAWAQVRSGLQTCFDRHTSSDERTRISVETRVTPRFERGVARLTLSPPLAPAPQSCVDGLQVRFPAGSEGVLLANSPRVVTLGL